MSKTQIASRDDLLRRRISQHFRDFHAADSTTPRRSFLRSAAGIAGLGLSGLGIPGLAQADDGDTGKGKSVSPNPIPEGVSPFGIFVHHVPVSPTTTPLQSLTEPSQITDFKGFVGLNRIRGGGMGQGFPSLAFQADMGFMKGVFIGTDGKHHQGAFAFI